MQYDRFQAEAIEHIKNGKSVIVSAPTGAGKTAIAEHIIERCLSEKKGVIYTAPIKALSNQKFRDFSRAYGKEIGILTGDVSLNPGASVLIMTTEIFRNTILEDPQRLAGISWVIFDELHYIDDYERGTVWEESLIFCPAHIRILALSATMPNTEELVLWIRKIHKNRIETVIEKNRPVPLHHSFQSQNKIFSSVYQLRKNCFKRHKYRYPQNKISSLLEHLKNTDRMPVIYFAFSRKRCEKLAFEIDKFNFLNSEEAQKLTNLFKELIEKFDLANEPSALRLWPVIKKGIAYHHAGLLPSLKEVVEQLFTSRMIKLIFTTETFALGINMPAKTVIFDDLRKFHGNFYGPLSSRDYYQMAGRAGRRGIDQEGFVYSRINPQRINFKQIKKIIYSDPEPVKSQFNLSYASLLHLYQKWKEQLYEIYPLSLHYFQSNKKARKNALKLLEAKIALLKDMQYIKDNHLTQKGKFASSVYGYELLLSELYSFGILEQLTPIDLNIVLACLVFEPRKNQLHVKLPSHILNIRKKVLPVSGFVEKKERKFKIYPYSKKPYFNLALGIESWSYGQSLSEVKLRINADEGEIIRYFRMVIQILRQLRSINLTSSGFKQRITESIILMNRDEVDAEQQLREGL